MAGVIAADSFAQPLQSWHRVAGAEDGLELPLTCWPRRVDPEVFTRAVNDAPDIFLHAIDSNLMWVMTNILQT